MSTVFNDGLLPDLQANAEAQARRARFRVVNAALARNATAGDEGVAAPTDEERDTQLAQFLALGTDAANFVIVDLLAKSQPVRAFVDAVMGATGGEGDFVFLTDEQLAERMGVTSKTVQKARKRFMEVKNYSVLIEIKRNYRDPVTRESFPHRYKCKLTRLAVEAMQNAQLTAKWSGGDAGDKMKAMRDAAEGVVKGAAFGKLTPDAKRRKPTDRDVVNTSLKLARTMLEKVKNRSRIHRNPDHEEIFELLEATRRELMEAYAAYDLKPKDSMQIQEEEGGTKTQEARPDISSPSRRMESEIISDFDDEDFRGAAEIDDGEARAHSENWGEDAARWNICSTQNDSTDSTIYEDEGFSEVGESPPDDDPLFNLYTEEVEHVFQTELDTGKSRTEARKAALEKVGMFPAWRDGRVKIFDRVFSRLGGGCRDG